MVKTRPRPLCVRMEASLFSLLPYSIYTSKALPLSLFLSEWRPLSFLYSCYILLIQGRQCLCQNGCLPLFPTVALYNSYKEGFLYLYSCCVQLIQRRHSLCQNGGLSLSYTVAIYKSYKEGTLPVRMEAFLFSIQLLYTSHHIKKAHSLSESKLLSFSYSCYIQLLSGRHSLCQNGGLSLLYTAAIYSSYNEGALSVRTEALLFSIQLLYTTHTRKALSLSEYRPSTQILPAS